MNNTLPECPVAMTIVLIGDKWKIQIMRELLLDWEKPKHFTDFKHAITGISDKMLSKSLKDLEEAHIIDRDIVNKKPTRSIYKLTDIGLELGDALLSLKKWGMKYQSAYRVEIHNKSEIL